MPANDRIRTNAQRAVLAWYDGHRRVFPWRETRDPYRTMVAEVMLQQTQTGRVVPIYERFLERFSSVSRLAHAPSMDVIQAWRGLGYNRRAVDLHRAAQTIEHDHAGVFPSDPATLKQLPGFGEYTANAVACFAFDAHVPVVDTNVRRVLSRVALGKDASEITPAASATLAAQWLPAGHAYRWNQALMDIGAMICRNGKPLCAQCPLSRACAYRAAGRHRDASARSERPKEPFEGSRRQTRGGIVNHLRTAARKGVTLGSLAGSMHHHERSLDWLVEILTQLESEGLAHLSPAARRGSPRGTVRLPG